MQYENIDFPESVRRLASRAGIAIIEDELSAEEEGKQSLRKRLLRLHFEASAWFHSNLLRTKAAAHARSYLQNREINIETAKRWQLGYAPNTWDSLVQWATDAGFVKEELIESGLVKLREEGNPARASTIDFGIAECSRSTMILAKSSLSVDGSWIQMPRAVNM